MVFKLIQMTITETWSSGHKIEVGKIYDGMEVIDINPGFDKYSPLRISYKVAGRGHLRIMYAADYCFVREFIDKTIDYIVTFVCGIEKKIIRIDRATSEKDAMRSAIVKARLMGFDVENSQIKIAKAAFQKRSIC